MTIDTAPYRALVNAFENLICANSALSDARLAPDKWTLKEMVAHLVDSASNNHQRFVRLQLEPTLAFPKYDAEEWRAVTAIGAFDYGSLAALWKHYNQLLLHLIEHANPAAQDNVWRREDKDISLGFLIHDYFEHMELHRKLFEERAGEIRAAG
jgi:hypothetical protein